VLDHLETGRHIFEHLPLVLSDPAECCATASRAGAGWFVGDGLARQMGWQWRADRVLALVGFGIRLVIGLGVRFDRADASVFGGSILFERADQQFELFNVPIELL
jgi:hypothetical protein